MDSLEVDSFFILKRLLAFALIHVFEKIEKVEGLSKIEFKD